jgi:type IV pilus assembly protein PilY1
MGSASTATDSDASNLINFVRGFDSYDENSNGSTSDFRWKLQDIYHSRPVYVSRPRSSINLDANYAGAEKYFESINSGSYARFYEANKTRREIVLVGSNSGVLHAVDALTGQEVWGFIPPPLLRKLSELPSTNPNSGKKSSVAIYGIDGNLAVRDVYVGGAWRTYVAITFGQGARAFTVIDVTNPDAPSHVFSIENRYENGIWVVNRWDSSGNLSVYPSTDSGLYSYKSLGYTTSSPLFAFLNDVYGRYVPILILGAGSNSGLDYSVGNVVYFVDIDGVDAGVVTERTPVGPFPFANLPINDLSTDIEVIESGRSERMKGRYGVEMFIPNSNGVVQTVDFSGASTAEVNLQNSPKTIFNSEATTTNDRLITSPISISTTTSRKFAGDLNLIFGTGDMDRLALYGTSPDNYVYSIQQTEFELMSPSSVLNGASLSSAATNSSMCPLPNSSKGWKIPINTLSGPSKSGATITTTSGKLASKIVQYGSSALISIYSPLTTNACSMGNSCFFERDSACGYPKNSACFANMMIGGVSTFQDKIFIGVSGNQGKETLSSGFSRTDNLVVGKGNFTSSSSGSINVYGRQRKR